MDQCDAAGRRARLVELDESGWHALAASQAPIEFSPQVGAIMYDHPAGGSKQMDGMEFRISWFKMLADVRDAAGRFGVSHRDWNRAFRTHQYATYASGCLRLSRDADTDADRVAGCRHQLGAERGGGGRDAARRAGRAPHRRRWNAQ
jgi:hypothetical protein